MPLRRTLGLLLAVALLILTGCSDTSDADSGKGFVAGQPGVTRVPVDERQLAPVASGTTLDDEEISTDAYAGQVVVINVWGSWCAPCRKEAPDLVAAADESGDKAQYIGLNTRDLDRAPAQAFVRAFDITYPSIYDPSGSELLKFADDLPPGAIPSTLVIDAEGRIAARVIGPISKGSLVQLVDDVAAGS